MPITSKELIAKLLLLPASKLYGAGAWFRNKLFDLNVIKSRQFDVPVVSVGNLVAGGTGKTPHVEFIINALRYNYHIGVLSRGYKRKTRGFVLATRRSTPADIGDEPFQIHAKYSGDVTVAVCEDRVKGIEELLRIDPEINLILLDDAFQHRYVKPAVNILLTECGKPYVKDKLLPYGRLRENPAGAIRADMILITKCPAQMSDLDYTLEAKVLERFPYQDLNFTRISYGALQPVFPDVHPEIPRLDWLTDCDCLLLLCGIGNPKPFVRYIRSFEPRVKINLYSDHHTFTRKDIEHIQRRYGDMTGNNNYIITTEKDAVRLAANPYYPHELKAVTFYVPIRIEFARHDSATFLDALQKRIEEWVSNHK